jgi:6-pyruvoyltetrahydropterin/6-carboxytetrahydropterin synthase
MPFTISAIREFAASHQLRLYDGAIEPLHGHNWRVKVTVGADGLDRIGVVMDFHKLERLMDEVLRPMADHHLNDISPFAQQNPSAENVAQHIAQALSLPAKVRLLSVEVWETEVNSALYVPSRGTGAPPGALGLWYNPDGTHWKTT